MFTIKIYDECGNEKTMVGCFYDFDSAEKWMTKEIYPLFEHDKKNWISTIALIQNKYEFHI